MTFCEGEGRGMLVCGSGRNARRNDGRAGGALYADWLSHHLCIDSMIIHLSALRRWSSRVPNPDLTVLMPERGATRIDSQRSSSMAVESVSSTLARLDYH